MKYHLNIIDGNVDIPKEIDLEYDDVLIAYENLFKFVHSFDDTDLQVDGRVVDENCEDIMYSSSIMNTKS